MKIKNKSHTLLSMSSYFSIGEKAKWNDKLCVVVRNNDVLGMKKSKSIVIQFDDTKQYMMLTDHNIKNLHKT
jgi:hypothetical protein